MNKNRYRVVYNKARQIFMAVAENVKSQTKNSGQSTASSTVKEQSQPFHQLWQVKCLVASMSLWMPLAPVYAQIQADNSANAGNRPVIGVGQNSQGQNVPVVNIQTPTNGVSHNIYKQMDVLPEGVVLNNSRTGANSALVGTVGANPFLAQGEARIILNEVNSNIATRFEGNLEVAGQRADVIIANPAGINIQGGGFINANKAILTTGKPQLNADGSIQQFIVDQGKIIVSAKSGSSLGLGGNNNNADYVDIYARALELNAQLYANKDIQAITGANNISADLQQLSNRTGTGTTPTLAIDVKNLGGMYANNIYLLGNEKGLGVSNAGTIRAVNNLVVTSAGKIEHTGSLESTSNTQGLVSLQTTQTGDNGNINSSGAITSKSMLSIDAANHLNIAGNQIVINQGIASPLLLSAQGDINVSNAANIQNNNLNGDIYLDAKNIRISESSQLNGLSNIYLNAEASIDIKGSSQIKALSNQNITAQKNIIVSDSTLNSENGKLNLETNKEDSTINLVNGLIGAKSDFRIYSGGDLSIYKIKYILDDKNLAYTKTENITLLANKNIAIEQDDGRNDFYKGNLKIQADGEFNLKTSGKTGELKSQKDVDISASNIQLVNISLAGNNVNLTAKNNIELQKNTRFWTRSGDINLSALNGELKAMGVNANATKGKISFFSSKDSILSNDGTLKTTLKGYQGVNVGTIGQGNLALQNTVLESQNGNIVVTSEGQNTLTDNTITAKGNIELFAKDNLILDGVKSSSQQHTALNSKKNIYINSQAGTGDSVNFNSTKTTELNSTGTLSLISDKNQNLQNTRLTGGAVLLEAGGALNTPKTIEFNATGSDLLKNDSKLNSLNGDLSIQTKESLTIDPTIHTLKAVGDIELTSKQGTLTLAGYGGQAGNGSEKVLNLTTNGGGISLEGASVEVQGSQLNAQKDIKIVSTQSSVKVDGLKSSIQNGLFLNRINEIKNNLLLTRNRQKEILENYEFIKDKNSLFSKMEFNNIDTNKLYSYFMESARNTPYDLSIEKAFRKYFEKDIELFEKKYGIDLIVKAYVNIYPEQGVLGFWGLDKLDVYSTVPFAKNLVELEEIASYFNQNLFGFEHQESILKSTDGNINVVSKGGLSISGTNISAKVGQVNIEAQGTLDQQYTSTATKGINGQPTQVGASIIIDGHTDFYDKGNENDANYSMRTFISPTMINGDKGVTIRATGNTNQDNLVLQATGITAANGDVRIEANKNILFDAAIEQSYDRSTTTEKKRSWGGVKKKYITTVAENNQADAASVDISGKNIFVESKEKNTANNIDIYSGKLTANGGQVSILSGGNINLYTVQESSNSNVDITKKSSFAGIKYNKSNTTSTRSQISELPGVLKADYIGIKADNDVRLVGTEFEYLQGAKIEAGRELSLLTASTTVTETLKKDKNSVVWQSMQDKGSVTETAQLPRFNGPTPPEFKAAGGLVVQIPIGEKDQNKIEIRDQILALANQPGNDYLKQLVNRNDVDWQKVILAQKDWDYKSQGLTAAGAAILALAIAFATGGAGVGALLGTTGTMTNAALLSLTTQASISLINNGGDVSATLKYLGSQQAIKGVVTSVVMAGLMPQIATQLGVQVNPTLFTDRLYSAFVNSTGSALVNTAINGGSLSDNLQSALLAGLASAVQGELAGNIKGLEDVNYVLHKIAHAAVGCATAAASKQSCEAGAIGAGVGEIVADQLLEGRNPTFISTDEKQRIEALGKLIAGTISAYTGNDVNEAANSAAIAIQNNAFKDKALLRIEAAKKYIDVNSKELVDTLTEAYKKGDIKKAQELKIRLDDSLDKWITSSNYEILGIHPKAAVGSLVHAVGELFIPSNVTDLIPIGKLKKAEKALGIVQDSVTKTGKGVFDTKLINQIQNRTDVKQLRYAEVGAKGNWSKAINGKLDKNTAYLVSNGHTYVTDSVGRVKEVSGELKAIKMDRNGYQQRCVGKCGAVGDEGGHLIAASLGGAGDRINIVPQNSVLNRNDYRAMEKELSEAVSSGKKVSVKIEVGYSGSNGVRPNEFRITATIDGAIKPFRFTQ